MKKIFALLILFASVIILASCNDDPKIKVECDAASSALYFTVECKNTKKVQKGTINLYLYKNYGETGQTLINARGCSNYVDTIAFTDLDPNTEYDLKITCTFDEELGHLVSVEKYKTLEITNSLVKNAADLSNIKSDLTVSTLYTLENDIDCNNEDFAPITNEAKASFKGTFDGNNKTISNLKIVPDTLDAKVGLFAGLEGTVKNLTIDNLTIEFSYKSSTTLYVGGIAGICNGTIENVTIKNLNIVFTDTYISSTNDRTAIGGLVGSLAASPKADDIQTVIKGCNVEGNIKITAANAIAKAGGLVGTSSHENKQGETITVENSKTNVTIEATNKYTASLGGAFAELDSKATIKNCNFKSNISLDNQSTLNKYDLSVGGVAGTSTAANLENVVTDTIISVKTSSKDSLVNVGSFIGKVGANINVKSSLAEGTISVVLPSDIVTDNVEIANFFGAFNLAGVTPAVTNSYSNTTGTSKIGETETALTFDTTSSVNYSKESFVASSELMSSLEFSQDLWKLDNGKIVLK